MPNALQRPVNARIARILLMGMTVLPGLFHALLPFIWSIMSACRAWGMRPYYIWRPFTALSLVAAFVAAMYWPYLGGQSIYAYVFGVLPNDENPLPDNLLTPVLLVILGYIAWSIVMLPHAVARITVLLIERRHNQELPGKSQT